MNKAKNSFFQRLFGRDDLLPAPTSLDARLDDLERRLKAAIREWDDALDLLTRKAGRANKLEGLAQPVSQSREDEINERIRRQRARMLPPNGKEQH